MIDSRQATPAHIRDLLLFAAHAATSEPDIDVSIVADLDVVDVMAVTATLVNGHLQALTASLGNPAARHAVAGALLADAAGMVPDHRAVNAAATVVGAAAQGELATGAAIARCLAAFTPAELVQGSIALLTASIGALAGATGVPVGEIVAWSAGDGERPQPVDRLPRVAFCGRASTDLQVHPHAR